MGRLDYINSRRISKRISPGMGCACSGDQTLSDFALFGGDGHLASNLGVVELTMAMYLSFSPPTDKIIWDVGHQSYA